ncbi:MAG: polyphenol oxidase family protein [Gemmatimonadota bacterium]
MTTPSGAGVVARTPEARLAGPVPIFSHPDWRTRFPWLVQGTTGRGDGEPWDLGLRGRAPVGSVLERWRTLGDTLGFPRMAHARQVHGARVIAHNGGPPGLLLSDACDGHLTGTAGILLTVSVADCVPVFMVDARRRVVALVHAGWRGIAAGVLEAGVRALEDRFGTQPADLHVYFGPSICGRCYEVGPEVFRALGLDPPDRPAPVDLVQVLALRASRIAVPQAQLSASAYCTRCGERDFFSHRAYRAGLGPAGHQVGFLGIRSAASGHHAG